jgi:uncharacterized protein YjbI with pentapeptide repeats
MPIPTVYGPYRASNANLKGSTFDNVNLSGSTFNNANLSNAQFHNVNFSGATVTSAQIGGIALRNIGPPPDADGNLTRPQPATFDTATLCDSLFTGCDLSGVKIEKCETSGMTIDGILVSDLLAAYRKVMHTI